MPPAPPRTRRRPTRTPRRSRPPQGATTRTAPAGPIPPRSRREPEGRGPRPDAGPRQVAGRDQAVVASPDDDGVHRQGIQDSQRLKETLLAIHAPALPTDAVWLNVERPLTTDDLRGRIVLFDFWTFG